MIRNINADASIPTYKKKNCVQKKCNQDEHQSKKAQFKLRRVLLRMGCGHDLSGVPCVIYDHCGRL